MEQFLENGDLLAAGAVIRCRKTNKYLILKRSQKVTTPNVWSMISGAIDVEDKSITDGLKREIYEETKIDTRLIDFKFIYFETHNNTHFNYFIGECDEELEPTLCDENSDWGWFYENNLPSPLFDGLELKIKQFKGYEW